MSPFAGKEQFLAAAAGLAQVATSLRAIAAWPTVPCDSDWVRGRERLGCDTAGLLVRDRF